MGWSPDPVSVQVPATSANLGPGFDSFGLALSLRDVVDLQVVDSGLRVEVAGEGDSSVPLDERHLVVRAVRAGLEAMQARPPGLVLRCHNAVPQGRGLGSSAGAIVAGLVAARTLVERSTVDSQPLDASDVLRLAAAMEGHPDNVAAALFGGLTLAWTDDEGVQALRLQPRVAAVALIPADGVSTDLARGMLPELVPHRDAAGNAARAGLLVAALTQRPDLLLAGTEDQLHQKYREAAMPDTLRVVHALRERGHAALVSGAGPTVLVLCGGDASGQLPPAALADELALAAPGWRVERLAVDSGGARVAA
jgi:homoserine kinase